MAMLWQSIWYFEAEGKDSMDSKALTVNIGSTRVVAKSCLQSHQEWQDESKVDSAISKYVQAGTPHDGWWPGIMQDNVTSITFYLNATNCYARVIAEVFAYG
jgi:hypothetical protein